MPQPELGPVNLNEVVRGIVKLFEAQFGAVGRPPITPELHLEEGLPTIQADATLLHRAHRESCAERDGRHARRRSADAAHDARKWQRRSGSFRHRHGADAGRDATASSLRTTRRSSTARGWDWRSCNRSSAITAGEFRSRARPGVGTSFHIRLPQKPPQRPAPSPAGEPATPRAPRARKCRRTCRESSHPDYRRRREHARVAFARVPAGGPRGDRLRQCRARARTGKGRALRSDSLRRGDARARTASRCSKT